MDDVLLRLNLVRAFATEAAESTRRAIRALASQGWDEENRKPLYQLVDTLIDAAVQARDLANEREEWLEQLGVDVWKGEYPSG